MQGIDKQREALVLLRIVLLDTTKDRRHFRLGLGQRDTSFESGEHSQRLTTAIVCPSSEIQWRPQFSSSGPEWRELKLGGHHTDYGVAFAVKSDLLTDDVRIATETSLPQRVTEHNDMITAGLILAGMEGAAKRRIHT